MPLITKDEMAKYMLETLEKIIESDFPESQRDEARWRILEAFGASMFKGPVTKQEEDK